MSFVIWIWQFARGRWITHRHPFNNSAKIHKCSWAVTFCLIRPQWCERVHVSPSVRICARACACKCDEWESVCVQTSRWFVNYRCICECECCWRLEELLIYKMMVMCLCFLKTMIATVCAHQIHTPTSLFWHIKIKFSFFFAQLPIWHLIHCFLVEFGWYFDSIGWCRPQRHFIIYIVKWSRGHTFRKNVRANISNIIQTICLKSYKKNYFLCSNANALKFYRHFTNGNFFEKGKKKYNRI